MLDTYDYTLRICKTDCFSTEIIVTRTHTDVKLYVHFLPCLFLGTFSKLYKVTDSFVMSVRMEQPGSYCKDCHKI